MYYKNIYDFRQEEKKILDRIMGPKVYDSRIRPSGLNGTGSILYHQNLNLELNNKRKL